jgi:outer membrane protein W
MDCVSKHGKGNGLYSINLKQKTMKKTKITTALFILGMGVSVCSFGQGLYLGIGGGYGFAAAKLGTSDHKGSNSTSGGTTTSSDTYTSRGISFGKGINLGLYGGYMFNKNIGAELGIGYLIGSTTTITDEQDNSSTSFGGTTSTDIRKTLYKGSMLRLVPSIRLQCGESKIHPYMVTGLILGIAGKYTEEIQGTSTSTGVGASSHTSEDLYTSNGGMSLGLHTALGVTYNVSDMLGIFVELSGNYLNYAPSKTVYTTSTSDGKDNLASMTTSQKETDYSSSYTTTNVPTPGSPSMSSIIRMPFSSYGFNIGVHLTLGGK